MSSQQMLVLLTATVFTTFFGCMILDSSWQRHSSVIFGRPLSMSQLKSLATKAPRSYFRNYINSLSDSELNELIQGHFGEVSGLKSAALQRDFMACPGVEMLKHFSDAEGVVQIPKQQQACKNDMSFQSSGAPVALVSWPGSGNSWVRQLLETSTGIYTGSVDCDLAYIGAGMIGEGIVSNNVIAVKSHFDPPMWKFPNKIIYIVRNPFDAFVADWNREKSGSGTPHISEASYKYFVNNSKWDSKVKTTAYWWRQHVEQWINGKHPVINGKHPVINGKHPVINGKHRVLVVKYENLLVDLKTELQRILDFLGHPYTDNDLNCTIHSTTERFHRKHSESAINRYTPEQKAHVNAQLQIANNILQKCDIEYEEQ